MIIGIFGGTNPAPERGEDLLGMARAVGRAVASCAVVLTGAKSVTDKGVKGETVRAAGDSKWIGIGPGGTLGFRTHGNGIVMTTGVRDKRNFLEAAICDGAVCLPGADETVSEAVFCISMGRPVAFWGDDWPHEAGLLTIDPEVLARLGQRAYARVAGSVAGAGLDPFISQQAVAERLQAWMPYRYFDSKADPQQVVKWLCRAIEVRNPNGRVELAL